jgi:thiol-disulfide isomerase/thioredoxin
MKKTSMLLLLTVILLSFTAKSQISQLAIIKGTISAKDIPAEITLYNVINGEAVLNSKVSVAKDGTFGFCFKPEYSGFYRIGERNSPGRIYISPGKQTSVAFKDQEFSITEKQDKENLKLVEWTNIIWKLKKANMLQGNETFKEIFPVLPDLEAEKDAFIAKTNTGNLFFDLLVKGIVQAEFEYELYHFLFMPRSAHPKFEEQPPMYKKYSSGPHFASTEVLKYDFGQSFIASYLQYLFTIKANEGIKYSPELADKMCIENIKNDTLKGWYFMSSLVRAKAYDQVYRDKVDKYKPYILSADQKTKLHDFELTIRKFGDNEPAIDFDGKTVEGKKVALSDFKGKVVVVDVWATWCGPCKGEIPSLQKLEEEMKGQDVVFMSYSIDEMKDHDKWMKFVADEKLGGVQIMGDLAWKSPICVNYKINAIPRFMVFNKQGQIVSIDAPRPSQPALKEMLEKLLK